MTKLSPVEVYERTGIAHFKNIISLEEINNFKKDFAKLNVNKPGARQQNLPQDFVEKLKHHDILETCAKYLIGKDAKLVRILTFNKTHENNWAVPWHQDRTIAVKEKHEYPGFGPWSNKDNCPHVEPPLEIMQHMTTLRLHLDDCGEENGPLLVLPGSHFLGKVTQQDILSEVPKHKIKTCLCKAGDIIAFAALTFHSSKKATSPSNRRVIHLEYASSKLPGKLEWHLS